MNATSERYSTQPVDRPAYLRARYQRLALVVNESQFDTVDSSDTETLVVSCDWILAKQAVARNRHCVHYELGLVDWEPPASLERELFIRANDWIYDGKTDLTLFDGVSLGKMFNQYGTMCLINFHRMHNAISRLIDMFSPEEVVFYDFMNDVNIMSRPLRVKLVQDVAEARGLTFTDALADDGAAHRQMSIIDTAASPEPLLRKVLRRLYIRGLEILSGLGCLIRGNRARALVLINTNMAEPLIRKFDGRGVEPVFRAQTPPKRGGILAHCIKTGIRLVDFSQPDLDAADRDRIAAIKAALTANVDAPGPVDVRFLRRAVMRDIVAEGKLEDAARDCKAAAEDIARIRPERLVVDGSRGRPVRAYIERARQKEIAVDYIWHSPLTPQNLYYDALGGDPLSEPLITRCLSWGPVNEQWMRDVEANMPSTRVGAPWGGRYNREQNIAAIDTDSNILILQYTPNICDLRGLNSNMYSSFIELVRTLQKLGFDNLRYKIHPGPGRWGTEYFEKIKKAFGIEVLVQKYEPYASCLEWSDIVIGPFLTGAKFETLMYSRPYFAMLLPPVRTYYDYYPGYPVFKSVEEVVDAIQGYDEDFVQAGENLINSVCAADTIPNGAHAFWDALRSPDIVDPAPAAIQDRNYG